MSAMMIGVENLNGDNIMGLVMGNININDKVESIDGIKGYISEIAPVGKDGHLGAIIYNSKRKMLFIVAQEDFYKWNKAKKYDVKIEDLKLNDALESDKGQKATVVKLLNIPTLFPNENNVLECGKIKKIVYLKDAKGLQKLFTNEDLKNWRLTEKINLPWFMEKGENNDKND